MMGYGPETVLLLLSYDRDQLGNQYITQEFLKQIAADSKVPIFGLFDTLLGSGIVGGSLASAETQGKLAGELAARVLRGDRPEDIPFVGLDAHRLLFDARQLQRFHIPEARVPPHAEVAFRQKTTWEEFGQVIFFGGLGLVTQGLIIVSLLINRSRRLFAEREARELAGKILTAQEDERSYLARELHDDLSQRLAAVAIEAGRLDNKAADSPTGKQALGRLKQGLASICDDLHRLSHSMHPSLLDDFGLVDALRSECDSLSARTDMPIDFQSDHVPSDLPRNVALCLYRVAQEAL